MRTLSQYPVVPTLGLVFLSLLSAAASPLSAATPAEALKARVVTPDALGPACSVSWQVRPMIASAAIPDEAKSLDMWATFWIGAPVKKEVLLAASSNIYSNTTKMNAMHVVSFYWSDADKAAKFFGFLTSRYQGDATHAFQLHDTILVAMTNLDVSAECFAAAQGRIEEAFKRALP